MHALLMRPEDIVAVVCGKETPLTHYHEGYIDFSSAKMWRDEYGTLHIEDARHHRAEHADGYWRQRQPSSAPLEPSHDEAPA